MIADRSCDIYFILFLDVDDGMCFAETRERCGHRQRILTVALRVLGKKVSDKVNRTISEVGHIAGLKFVEGGVTLDDEAVAARAVKLALEEVC